MSTPQTLSRYVSTQSYVCLVYVCLDMYLCFKLHSGLLLECWYSFDTWWSFIRTVLLSSKSMWWLNYKGTLLKILHLPIHHLFDVLWSIWLPAIYLSEGYWVIGFTSRIKLLRLVKQSPAQWLVVMHTQSIHVNCTCMWMYMYIQVLCFNFPSFFTFRSWPKLVR